MKSSYLYVDIIIIFFFLTDQERVLKMEGHEVKEIYTKDQDNEIERVAKENEVNTTVNSDKLDNEKEVAKENDASIIINLDKSDTLSKRQKKKLMKRQRWIDTREERKKKEREKQKLRLEAKRAAGEICGNVLRKRLKGTTMAGSSCKQRVAVDMSFDDLMIEKHLAQCIKQISRCYSANRRVTDPMQLYVTNFKGKCLELMSRQNGYSNWDIHFESENYLDVFSKEDIVYLTSESDNVITTLDVTKVYVIGGLVDHNVHKGLCYKLALEKGLHHAKLPIDDFIEMKTRKVLTVDQVFKILLGVSQGKAWKDSFLEAIPPRKGAVGKDDLNENDFSGERSDDSQDMQKTENVENGENPKPTESPMQEK